MSFPHPSHAAGLIDLGGPFDLAAPRAVVPHDARMETTYVHYATDGRRLESEVFALTLRCPPASGGTAPFVCEELVVTIADDPRIALPSLRDWRYEFDPTMTGADGRGPLWGIDQEIFHSLSDASGAFLPFKIRYAAYVNFIDFHSLNDVFTRPMPFGQGIQNLARIGDRVVHPASHIEASVGFGTEIGPGSMFRNGEITLEFKGIGLIDGAPCAIVAYDAGESKLRMAVNGSDGERGVASGGSLYKGDIWVDLSSRWVVKATLDEYQIAETQTSGSAPSRVEYTARHLALRSRPRSE
ncbi:MAG: hypothetical protein ABSC46_12745 [Candidatus Limnocylindrales bacterium]|jgi:hypothetical protein